MITLYMLARSHADAARLELVNDGTYSGENGVTFTKRGKRASRRRLGGSDRATKRESLYVAAYAKTLDAGSDARTPAAKSPSTEPTTGTAPPLPSWVAELYPHLEESLLVAWEVFSTAPDRALMDAFEGASRESHWRGIQAKRAKTLRSRILKAEHDLYLPHIEMLFRIAFHLDPARGERAVRRALEAPRDSDARLDVELIAAQHFWSAEELLDAMADPPGDIASPSGHLSKEADVLSRLLAENAAIAAKALQRRIEEGVVRIETLLETPQAEASRDEIAHQNTEMPNALKAPLLHARALLLRDASYADLIGASERRVLAAVRSMNDHAAWIEYVKSAFECIRRGG
jgi:hypothetical protein